MARRDDLQEWVVASLKAHKGSATITQSAKFIWEHYEQDLRRSGDLFFTWQYDMRWACTKLREKNVVAPHHSGSPGLWRLVL